MFKALNDHLAGKVPPGHRRSPKWPRVRAGHLARFPTCAACGGSKRLEVHHVHPFHLEAGLELEPSNLITLCEAKANGLNCHLALGHLGSYRSFNAQVAADAAAWLEKFKGRP